MEINNQPKTKTPVIKRLLPVLLVLIVVFVLLQVMKGMKQEPVKVPEKPKGFLVQTATVDSVDLALTIHSQGTLLPKRQINLTTEVSGKVLSLSPAFVVGGRFQAGDVLVAIDPADYKVAVARAEANLASAQAQLNLEQAKSDQARKDWQSFGKKGQPSDLLLNIPQLEGAQASVNAAKADLMKARRDLLKTEIKAPFNGTVISKAVDLGQFIGMSGSLGVIAGSDVAEVRLPLTNQDLEKLNLLNRSLETQPLTVKFINDEKIVAEGVIKRLESSKDVKTLLNYAVAEVEQPIEKGLLYNTFLQAHITGPSLQGVFAIPTAWMMPNDQLAVYQKDGTLAIKSVNVVHKTNDYFYVSSGLSRQDAIISTPIQAPEPGMQLRLATEHADQAAAEGTNP
jgi:RND family efflux transporter MFP subunit